MGMQNNKGKRESKGQQTTKAFSEFQINSDKKAVHFESAATRATNTLVLRDIGLGRVYVVID